MNVPGQNAVASTWQDVVRIITAEAHAAGLTGDQANAAVTVAKVENGWSGNVGDNGTSFGPFQFHKGGQLDSFAAWLGLPILANGAINPAVISAANNLELATQFALQEGGYLHNAIVNGSKGGYSGLNLALYTEQYGQGAAWTAQAVSNVTAAWVSLFGKDNPQPTDTTTVGPPGPAPIVPDKSTVPVIGNIVDAVTYVGTAIGNVGKGITDLPVAAAQIILSVERFFWIVIGLLVVALGVWLLVKSEPEKVEQVTE